MNAKIQARGQGIGEGGLTNTEIKPKETKTGQVMNTDSKPIDKQTEIQAKEGRQTDQCLNLPSNEMSSNEMSQTAQQRNVQ